MNNIHTKETGHIYSQPWRFAAIILIVVPFFLLQDVLWLAAIIALLGLIVYDATTGIQVDLDNRQYKLYTNFFGLIFGKWVRIQKNQHLLITYLYRKKTRKAKSLPEDPLSLRDMEFFVHVTDENIKPIKEIYKCFEEQEAIDFAMSIAEHMDLEVWDYYYNDKRKLRSKGDPPRFVEED